MDNWLIILRILHIVFGVLLIGNVLFMTLFLQHRLKKLGPAVMMPVMSAILPVVTPAQIASYAVILGSGTAIALILRHASLGTFFASGWGWAILIGFVAFVAAGIVGFGIVTPAGMRLTKLGGSIKGRPPTPEEGARMQALGARVTKWSRVNVGLALVILGAMASARFV
ncbi:MAG: hypothetical protein EXR60_02110 [Dehalococcoidia bacterium]|nr:hypothetical protein [Dehalococcoidia bacterium]